MILKATASGVPNNQHKKYIRPTEKNEKAWVNKNRTSYELIIGEEYEVDFPETMPDVYAETLKERQTKTIPYEKPPWFNYDKKPANKISSTKG